MKVRMKVRIVKKNYKDGEFRFIPQYKKFLFWRHIPLIKKSLDISTVTDFWGFVHYLYYEYESLYEAETQIERFKAYKEKKAVEGKIQNKEIVYESNI